MIPLRWRLSQSARLLGWQGIIGLVLFAAAGAFYLGAIHPAQAQLRVLQQEVASMRTLSRSNTAAVRAVVPDRERSLQQFYGQLPERASAPDLLRIIFAAARAQSLGLQQGEYKLTLDRHGRLLSYEIGLPVRGRYVQVRKFVADVLDKIPAIALDEITIKREAIGDSSIDASIRFTLFLNAS
jgi:Tfp pilus assembly protein PilO